MKNKFLVFAATALIALSGCYKDAFVVSDDSAYDSGEIDINLQKVMKWWGVHMPLELRSAGDTIPRAVPLWGQAIQTKFRGVEAIVLVPVDLSSILDMEGRGRVMIVFFMDQNTNQIRARWHGYYALADAYPRHLSQFDVNDFTGYFFELAPSGNVANILRITNGAIDGYRAGYKSSGVTGGGSDIEFRCDDVAGSSCCFPPFVTTCCCPGFGGDGGNDDIYYDAGDPAGGFGGFFSKLGDFFSNLTPTPGEPDPYFHPAIFNFNPFREFGNNFNGEGPPGGTGLNLNEYFNNDIFNQTYDPERSELVNQFRSRQGIDIPSSILLFLINPYCFDEPESFDECALWSILNWLDEEIGLTQEQRELLSENTDLLSEVLALFFHLANDGFSLQETSIVFEVLSSGRLPCLATSDLTYVGNGVYINFSNFAYNWYQHSTGLTYSTEWTSFCIQIPATFSDAGTLKQLAIAFTLALMSTEAQLLRMEKVGNPILSIDEIKQEYKMQLKTALESRFGGGVSINTFPGGCQGIPETPYISGC